jgi:hypothetical protein
MKKLGYISYFIGIYNIFAILFIIFAFYEGHKLNIGWNNGLKFINLDINTWYKYLLLIIFIFITILVSEYTEDLIYPITLNTIYSQINDIKTIHDKRDIIHSSVQRDINNELTKAIGLFLVLDQFDILIIYIFFKVSIGFCISIYYMKNKKLIDINENNENEMEAVIKNDKI